MTPFTRNFAAALIALSLLGAAAYGAFAAAPARHYVCVPCGLPCDATVFDKPGTCPQCGMALVEQGSPESIAAPDTRKKVGILVFNGVEIIDYSGPYEVFGAANYDVFTVAATPDPVTTAMGLTVVPRYTFATAPQPDVLVVPGGGVRGAQRDPATLKYVADATAKTEHTMSVCNGSFILASAGVLDGLTATSTYGNVATLKAEFPKIKVVGNQRYVDNGKVITTAGLSAGIDGALHVVAVMQGDTAAREVALQEEYDWHPDAGYVRPSLADRLLPHIDLDKTVEAVGKWDIVSNAGGADRWRLVVKGGTRLSSSEVLTNLTRAFESEAKWTHVESSATDPASWKFNDFDGHDWKGTLTVKPVQGAARQYTVTLAIERAS